MTTATEKFHQSVSDAAGSATASDDHDSGNHAFVSSNKGEQLKALVEELCSLVPDAVCNKDDCSQMLMDGKERAMKAGKKVFTTIRSHPVETALIAVGVGFATWWLINRK